MTRSLVSCLLLAALVGSPVAAAAPRSATPPESISVPEGFEVELVRSAQDGESSWISMTFDAQGRVIVGLDDVGVARLAPPADAGGEWSFTRLDDTLRHCRGVLAHRGDLYVNATDSKELWRFRDPGGDGAYAERTLLESFDYRSRYGHGQNQLTVGPDGALYSIVGNDVSFPEGSDPLSPYRGASLDRLLLDPADAGHDDRVGYLLRFDPDGSSWSIVAGGFRNQVDAAWNADGEWFTQDADMEWDVGQPWYRPTRVNHVVPGGEYGWRWGTSKWPVYYPDSLPTTLDTGLGSPTGVLFGTTSNFPGKWREAFYMADWQHGRILAAWFTPEGATYSATDALFAEGSPLNVCDLGLGPDGCLWFVTGGRGSQSGLYRVSFTGDAAGVPPAPSVADDVAEAAKRARARRHELERLLVVPPRAATIEALWPELASPDRWLRFTARAVLERQPLDGWRDRARAERVPLARGEALLAWARIAPEGERADVVRALLAGPPGAEEPDVLLACRTLAILMARGVDSSASRTAELHAFLDRLDDHPSAAVQRELVELLVASAHPAAVDRVLARLDRAASQEEEIHCVHALVRHAGPWTVAAHRRLLEWFAGARSYRGGHLLSQILARMQADLLTTVTDAERPELAGALAALESPPAEAAAVRSTRPLVKRWTLEEVTRNLAPGAIDGRGRKAGLEALAAGECLKCHRFGDSGSSIGPDLSAVGKRFDALAILESILQPSKVVDPKYHATTWVLADGRVVTGRANMVSAAEIGVETDPLSGASVKIARAEIESSHPSTVSPMPEGLVDTLTLDELFDLLALLRAGPAAR